MMYPMMFVVSLFFIVLCILFGLLLVAGLVWFMASLSATRQLPRGKNMSSMNLSSLPYEQGYTEVLPPAQIYQQGGQHYSDPASLIDQPAAQYPNPPRGG